MAITPPEIAQAASFIRSVGTPQRLGRRLARADGAQRAANPGILDGPRDPDRDQRQHQHHAEDILRCPPNHAGAGGAMVASPEAPPRYSLLWTAVSEHHHQRHRRDGEIDALDAQGQGSR